MSHFRQEFKAKENSHLSNWFFKNAVDTEAAFFLTLRTRHEAIGLLSSTLK